MQIIRSKSAILLALLVFAAAPAHAQVARVLEVKGTTLVERAGQPPRILGTNDPLDAQQVVTVARDSHAIIEFSDKTRVTLRPGTIFRVDDYRQGSPESYLRGLLKGGARIIGNPTAHSAEFDARLCEKDCAEEDRLRPEPRGLGNPVARVVEMKGTVAAARAGGNARMLAPGAAIYERDGVATGANSYAVLVFSDDSRISLAENSRLAISAYRFDDRQRTGIAELHHLAGFARVQSGAIAKQGPAYYRFVTSMGTVRPLGTLFDSCNKCNQAVDQVQQAGETVVGAVRDTAGQAAQTALNAAIRPILETMSALMTGLRDNPPTTEAGWNELTSKMTQMSDQLHRALDEAIRLGGAAVDTREFKTTVGLALAAELEFFAMGAYSTATAGSAATFGAEQGFAQLGTLKALVEDAKDRPYLSESLDLVGLSSPDLDRLSISNQYSAHIIIEAEVGGYLALQGNAAAHDFFAQAQAAAAALQQRAQQAEAAAAQAAEEAERRASDDAQRLADEARDAEIEAARLAAEAEELRQRQREKLQEDQAKLKEVADAAKETGKAVVEAGQDAVNQAAQAALDAATAPIMREMTRLMSEIKNNPPTTEAGWNELMSQMTEMSSRLDDAMDAVVSANVAILNSDAYKAMSGVGLAGELQLYAVLAVERGELGDAAFLALRMHMAAMTVADYERLAALGLSFADLMRVRESQYEAHFIIQTEIMSHLTSQGSAAAREFFAAAQAAGQAMQQRAQQAEEAAARAAEEAAKRAAEDARRAAEKARAAKIEAERLAAKGKAKVEQAGQDVVKTVMGGPGSVSIDPGTLMDGPGPVGTGPGAPAPPPVIGEVIGDILGGEVVRDITTTIMGGPGSIPGGGIGGQISEGTQGAKEAGQRALDEVKRGAEEAGAQSEKVLRTIEDIRAAEREFARQVADLKNALDGMTNLSETEKQRVRDTLDEWSRLVREEVARKIAEVTQNPNAQIAITTLQIMGVIVATLAAVLLFGVVGVPLAVLVILSVAAHTAMTNPSVFDGVPASVIAQAKSGPDQAAEAMRGILAAMVEHGKLGADEAAQIGRDILGQISDAGQDAARDKSRLTRGSKTQSIRHGWQQAKGRETERDRGSSGQDSQPEDESAASASNGQSSQLTPNVVVWDGSVEIAGRIVRKGESLRAASDGQLESGTSSGAPVINAPRPDLVAVDPNLFGGANEIPPGLYVWVRDGVITLNQDGRQVAVAAGNAAFATKDQMMLLDHVPNFMRFDRTPPPDGSGKGFTPPPFVLNDGSVAGSCAAK